MGRPILAAIGITLVLWGVIGGVGFAVGGQVIADHFGSSLVGTFLLDLIFLVCAVAIIALIVWWQRSHGETLGDLGWRRPTRTTTVAVAVIYGGLWVTTAYARGSNPFALTWERPAMILIGPVLAFAEELAVRGFFLEQLRRARVASWAQVLLSGGIMGVYHGILGFHFSVQYAISSAFIFGVLTLLFLWGKRSLTPSLTAHTMAHVLGDPALTQGILIGILAAH